MITTYESKNTSSNLCTTKARQVGLGNGAVFVEQLDLTLFVSSNDLALFGGCNRGKVDWVRVDLAVVEWTLGEQNVRAPSLTCFLRLPCASQTGEDRL